MRGAMLLTLLFVLSAAAQFQPVQAPDWSGLHQREDLAPAGPLEGAQRVLRFVQVSDAHILDDDAPYPLRQEPLDAFGKPFTSAQRPQDEFTDEVLDAMVRAINAVHAQDRLDFVINTGDNIDNELENELMRFIDNWESTLTTVGPVSGLVCRPDGQSRDVSDDAHDVTDACTHLPEHLAADNTPLAPGLPWFSAFGNHDGLIQGNVPVEPTFDDIAAQYGRYFLRQHEYVGMHFAGGTGCADGAPAGGPHDDFGHGYGFAGGRLCDDDPDNDGYYAFGSRGVHFIVLDTVNDDFVTGNSHLTGHFHPEKTVGYDIIGGYAEGSIDPAQFDWLMEEVRKNRDKLVVVMGHHTVNSMFSRSFEDNCGGPGGECLHDLLTAAGYKTGPELVAALAEHPHVVAWIGGHTHRHRIEAKQAGAGGFWNIETSSLIDMPQEARVIEVWVTADGTKGFFAFGRLGHDFEPSRELAMADPQHSGASGEVQDQDVILWFDIPQDVRLLPQASLPRLLSPRLVEPVAVNGSHGHAGSHVTVRLHVQDNLLQQPVDGLELRVHVERADAASPGGFALVERTPPQALGGGDYSFTFLPDAPRIHYVRYTFSDPSGTYPDASRVVSFAIAGDVEELHRSKKSPVPLAVLAIAGALVALRRR